MRKIMVVGLALCCSAAAGCSREEALLLAVETSLAEQFEVACGTNKKCAHVVNTSAEACFDPQLARQAIDATPQIQKQVNTQQILSMQACLAKAAGEDYWAGMDMPRLILDQVGHGS